MAKINARNASSFLITKRHPAEMSFTFIWGTILGQNIRIIVPTFVTKITEYLYSGWDFSSDEFLLFYSKF